MLRSPLCRASLVLPICLAFAASCADSRPKDREEQVAQRRVVILDTLANGLFDVLGLLTVDPDTIVLLDGGAEEHLSWWAGGHLVRTGGRRGRGPGELVRPRRLFRVTDMTFAVLPWVGRRTSHFTNQGTFDTIVTRDRGLALVGGELFPGAGGTLFFVGERSGSPPALSDSLTIWKLDLRRGSAQEWGRADGGAGGGRYEQTTAFGTVVGWVPLWVGDIVLAWSTDTALVIDPRAARIRMIGPDHGTQQVQISGLRVREVSSTVRDSIIHRWRNHPNAAYRALRFEIPAEYALFDHVIADVSHQRLWGRTFSDTDSTSYAMIAMPSGKAAAAAVFPGQVELLFATGDSLIALATGAEEQAVILYRLSPSR